MAELALGGVDPPPGGEILVRLRAAGPPQGKVFAALMVKPHLK